MYFIISYNSIFIDIRCNDLSFFQILKLCSNFWIGIRCVSSHIILIKNGYIFYLSRGKGENYNSHRNCCKVTSEIFFHSEIFVSHTLLRRLRILWNMLFFNFSILWYIFDILLNGIMKENVEISKKWNSYAAVWFYLFFFFLSSI